MAVMLTIQSLATESMTDLDFRKRSSTYIWILQNTSIEDDVVNSVNIPHCNYLLSEVLIFVRSSYIDSVPVPHLL